MRVITSASAWSGRRSSPPGAIPSGWCPATRWRSVPRPNMSPNSRRALRSRAAGWMRDLRAGDVLLQRSGERVTIERVRTYNRCLEVYNLRVAELETYAVGFSQVLTHNYPPEGGNAPRSAIPAAKAEANAVVEDGLSGKASALETEQGTYPGRSTRAGGGPLSPEVEGYYAEVPEALRPDYHGDCAEGRSISDVLADGADVRAPKWRRCMLEVRSMASRLSQGTKGDIAALTWWLWANQVIQNEGTKGDIAL